MKKQEDQHMDAKIEQLTQDLATANAKLAQANELVEARGKEVKSYADKTAALETQVKDLTARAEKSEGQVREYQEKEVTAKVTGTIDKLITEKKLAPAMKEKAYTLLRAVVDSGTEKKYKLGKDGKEQTLEDLAVELLGSSGVPLNTYARTGAGERQEGVQDGEGDINTDLAEKAKKYQETHKGVSYGDALKAVAREEGVDPSLRK
jgi:chromosome segregation ATPase